MKPTKKLLSIFLAVMMIVSIVPISAVAEDGVLTEGAFSYVVDGGYAMIVGVDETAEGILEIPDFLGGYPLAMVADRYLGGNSKITDVVLSNSDFYSPSLDMPNYMFKEALTVNTVIAKEDNPFYCSDDNKVLYDKNKRQILYVPNDIKSFTIPDSVVKIGLYSFMNCKNLKEIVIPANVKFIDTEAFSGCTNLEKIVFVGSVTSIADGAFKNCESLTEITIPEGCSFVGENAFSGCLLLEQVSLPTSLTQIGKNIFSDCSKLVNNANYWSDGLFYIDNHLLAADESIIGETLTVKNGTVCIADEVFYSFESLSNILLPEELKGIGNNAFKNTGFMSNSENYVDGCLYLDSYLIGVDNSAIGDTVTVKDGTVLISDYAFEYCSNVKNVILPDSVEIIGVGAFKDCSNLKEITLSSKITEIKNEIFYGCSSLKSIILPETVTHIGDGAFKFCSALETINIPENLECFGNEVFDNCSALSFDEFVIPKSFSTFYDIVYGFAGTKNIKKVVLPEFVEMFSFTAFMEGGKYDIYVENPDCILTGMGYVDYFINMYKSGMMTEDDLNQIIPDVTIYSHSNYRIAETCEKYDIPFVGLCDDFAATEIESKAPTCTEVGHTAKVVCSDCGYVISQSVEIPATGHTYGEWITEIEPTFLETGLAIRYCEHCNLTETQEIPCLVPDESIENGDVKVEFEDGAFDDEDVKLEVEDVPETEENKDTYVLIKDHFNKPHDYKLNTKVYEINPKSGDTKVQPNGKVLVRVPVPNGFKNDKLTVLHIKDDGTVEELPCEFKDGYVYFETDSFSKFAVVETPEEQEITGLALVLCKLFDMLCTMFKVPEKYPAIEAAILKLFGIFS